MIAENPHVRLAAATAPCPFLNDLMNFLNDDDPLEVVREYVQNNLELINSRDVYGRTGVFLIAKSNRWRYLEVILQCGGDPNICNFSGVTPLMKVARHNHVECLRLLIEHGANVNQLDPNGFSALLEASYFGYPHCVELLLTARATTDNQNQDGRSALMEASLKGNLTCLQLLLTHNPPAAVDLLDTEGYTALQLAAYNGHLDCLRLLLSHGANHRLCHKLGKNALVHATEGKHEACVAYLSSFTCRDAFLLFLYRTDCLSLKSPSELFGPAPSGYDPLSSAPFPCSPPSTQAVLSILRNHDLVRYLCQYL